MSTTRLARLARLVTAVPLLFTFFYVSHCADGGDGFILSLKVANVTFTATSCR
jgi:hypothetical protein